MYQLLRFLHKNDNKLSEKLTKGFKRTIKWCKYRTRMTNQTKNSN